MDLTLPLWLVALAALLILVLGVMIWSSRRTLSGNISAVRLEAIEDLLPNLAALTGEPVLDGNAVEVIQDDGFFDALLEEIRRAESSIHYETYVWWKGDICHQFATAFAEKARSGVEVRLLLDAHGSLLMDPDVLESLKSSGCKIGRYHPFRLRDIGKVNSRDHRKIAVIDGRTAFFMGHGMASEWCAVDDGGKGWRDTAVRLRGPVVRSAQSVFLRNWLNVCDEIAIEAKHFPELEPEGESKVHIADSDPVGTYSEVEVLLKVAIASAREQVLIQNPYFVPDESVIELLGAADERGVDVQIMLPRENDSRLVRHASHKFYGQLLRRGVRLWEYQPTFAHQKIVVVDGAWSHVGSTNFDHRSLQINREVSVGIYDPRIAGELIAAWESDLEDCEEITLEGWESRSSWKRLGDELAFLIREQI
jgi:cardiolipin synthase A/B